MIGALASIEKYFGYFVDGATEISELVLTNLFDRMTQDVFYEQEDLPNTSLLPKKKISFNGETVLAMERVQTSKSKVKRVNQTLASK